MKLRPIIFWSHLAVGVTAGFVILMMSVTGVLLTYERQFIEWADQQFATSPVTSVPALSADELLNIGRAAEPGANSFELKFVNKPGSPVTVTADRERTLLVDPYSGDILRDGRGTTAEFFRVVTRVHRWFAASDENFDFARATTAYSNLLFVFLILSGVYLWLPRVWHWSILKTKLFFNPRATNSKARDYNWHHVFSVWALVPLFLIATSGSVFYFSWASSAIYAAFGEEPPVRGRAGESAVGEALPVETMPQQGLLIAAQQHALTHEAADWHSIKLRTNALPESSTTFVIDRSIGRRPDFAYELTLDSSNASVIEVKRNDDKTPGAKARTFVRFLHTGEVFGFLGQTLAGLASLAACLLAYTGIALAWRRLISPLFRKTA
ncbi:MAG: PepSY-associated TM helix domain-containing protein [Woeseia sp.]